MEGEGRTRRGVRRWAIGGAAVLLVMTVLGLSLSYLFLVVRDQPLAAGGELMGASPASYVAGPRSNSAADVADYVDGETITVQTSVRNQGRAAVTITGVHTDSPYWVGLMRLDAARPAVMQGPAPCCVVDQAATWATKNFSPMVIAAGEEGVVVLHLKLGHCEDNEVGSSNELDGISIDYQELGWHGTQMVPLSLPVVVRYTAAGACPRPARHPAPPSAAPNQAPQAPSTPG